MITEDQIWFRLHKELKKESNRALPEAIEEVEVFFEKLVGLRPLLFPSARSAISAVLNLKGMSRAHTIYAPKWSSFCVWETIGRRSNPTSEWNAKLDAALVVHRWGHVVKTPEASRPKLIIEDSVDSLITAKKALFPNGGDFEVQSLPKLIGSYSGGIIYCRKPSDRMALLEKRNQSNAELAASQEALKWAVVNKKKFPEVWHPWEWKNFGLVDRAVSNILYELPKYMENIETCTRRKLVVEKFFPRAQVEGRIATVWPVNILKKLPSLHFDQALSTDQPNWVKVGCLPLHAEITDEEFTEILKDAQKSVPGARV